MAFCKVEDEAAEVVACEPEIAFAAGAAELESRLAFALASKCDEIELCAVALRGFCASLCEVQRDAACCAQQLVAEDLGATECFALLVELQR